MSRKFILPLTRGIISVVFMLSLCHSTIQPAQAENKPAQTSIGTTDPFAGVIEKYRASIPEMMQQKNIPGLSIALVDDGKVVWSEGFGYTDWDRATPITPDTPFSLQSISKSFTAAVVMLAIQDGLLDLDTPLSTYLPDFQVNSIFEENPEDLITIRHLLSHTAGYTHEAPLGNNYQSSVAAFEDHIASIQHTWLKFPVGKGYSYSNLGIDLAAYLVQVKSGMPFVQYAKQKLFDPLGMVNSTYDLAVIKNNSKRALGHGVFMEEFPLCPMLGSGGLYSSVNDMARFLQMLTNHGMVNGVQVMNNELIDVMSTHQFVASAENYYGLGIGVGIGFNTLQLNHGGGGFGFLTMMTFYPELDLGLVWLTNSSDHDLQSYFTNDILNEVIMANLDTYKQRVRENPVTPVRHFGFDDIKPLSSYQIEDTIRNLTLSTSPESFERWKSYSGVYFSTSLGRVGDIWKIRVKDDSLEINGQKLFEVQPGLFFTAAGEALDIRSDVPSFRSIALDRLEFTGLIFGFWIFCALIFVAAILWVLVTGIRRMIMRKKANAAISIMTPAEHLQRWFIVLGSIWGLVLTAVYYMFPIFIVDWFPSAFNPNLLLWQKLIFTAPIGMFIFGLAAVVLWLRQRKSLGKGLLPIKVDLLFPVVMVIFALVSYF